MTDLVHLLAELLENATTFSSPQTKVRVTATRLPDGRVMVEIHDKGIGLTAEDFADINHKLADPPTVDVAVSQRMGLFVVGRLADRHGIRVQLRPSGEQAGTTSLVMLPEPITHGGGGEDQPGGATSPSRGSCPSSRRPPSPRDYRPADRRRTRLRRLAATRAPAVVGPRRCDPVGRSLRREERRRRPWRPQRTAQRAPDAHRAGRSFGAEQPQQHGYAYPQQATSSRATPAATPTAAVLTRPASDAHRARQGYQGYGRAQPHGCRSSQRRARSPSGARFRPAADLATSRLAARHVPGQPAGRLQRPFRRAGRQPDDWSHGPLPAGRRERVGFDRRSRERRTERRLRLR